MTDQQPKSDPDQNQNEHELPDVLPILPLFDAALYPKMVLPLVVMQPDSIQLVDEAMAKNRMIALVLSKKQVQETAGLKENLYGIDLNPLAVKLTEMNLILKGNVYFPTETNIFEGNSLIKADSAEDLTLFSNSYEEHPEGLKNILKNNSYDITIGNPPYLSFGLKGTRKLEKEWHAYIKQRYPFSAQYLGGNL